jgi:hemerythrin
MPRYVTWQSSYSVGHADMDNQHKQILEIVNDLYTAMEKGKGNEVVKPLLDRLVRYTHTHFQAEEQVMTECGCPDLPQHKQLHDEMRRKTIGLRQHAGLVLGPDLLRFLKDWWVNHIQDEDKKYAAYLTASVAP